jgi:hypothetical protein
MLRLKSNLVFSVLALTLGFELARHAFCNGVGGWYAGETTYWMTDL